jgi:hypothetical protein
MHIQKEEIESMSQEIFSKIPLIIAELGVINKNHRTNHGERYLFMGIDDIYNALNPLMARHGVFSTTQVMEYQQKERTSKGGLPMIHTVLTVKFTFYATDASNVEVVTVGEALDVSDKSSNKAMSAAHKYALKQLFIIMTGVSDDTENDNYEIYQHQSPPPGRSLDEQPDPPKHLGQREAMEAWLLEMAGGDKAAAGKLLQEFTAFKDFKGYNSVKAISDKVMGLGYLYKKIETAYNKHCKENELDQPPV